jgi:hypothetical protein
VVKNVTWYEFQPRVEREERGEREEDLRWRSCSSVLSSSLFSFLFFHHDAKFKFERTKTFLFVIPRNTFFLSTSVINKIIRTKERVTSIAALVVVRFDIVCGRVLVS